MSAGAHRTDLALPGKHFLQADIVLPAVAEIVLVEKPLAQSETKVRQPYLLSVVVEADASVMSG